MNTEVYCDRFRLDAKNAVVTGGCGILGKKFSLGLAQAGANVAVVDIDEGGAVSWARELGALTGRKCIGIACDVASPTSVAEMAQIVQGVFGAVHILHNNAACKSSDLEAFFAPFEEYSLKQWREIMSVNIDGMFLVAQAIGKGMVAHKLGGSIVQTASIYGIVAPDSRIYEGSHYLGRAINTPAVYMASKSAVIGLTKYLATYWASAGIRVNSLSPGGVESGQNLEFRQKYSGKVPMARMGQAGEMVGALLYLASDASSYVTGQNLTVDGGLTAW